MKNPFNRFPEVSIEAVINAVVGKPGIFEFQGRQFVRGTVIMQPDHNVISAVEVDASRQAIGIALISPKSDELTTISPLMDFGNKVTSIFRLDLLPTMWVIRCIDGRHPEPHDATETLQALNVGLMVGLPVLKAQLWDLSDDNRRIRQAIGDELTEELAEPMPRPINEDIPLVATAIAKALPLM